MQLTKSLLLLTAVSAGSVLASPTHQHRHQKFHENKRAVGDIVVVTMDGVVVSWTNEYSGETSTTAPAATGSTSTAASVSATATASSTSDETSTSASSSSASSSTGFCKRATDAEIAYAGNTGECGYGTNILEIATSEVSSYDYTLTFDNTASTEVACQCGNKVGSTGEVNGFFGDGVIQFTLSAGSSKAVAFDTNSQGECMCAEGTSVPESTYGEALGAWVEFSFGDTENDDWSGLDISIIAAQTYDASYPSMSVCFNDECSSVTSSGTVDNAYDTSNTDADGIGLNIEPGNVAAKVTIS